MPVIATEAAALAAARELLASHPLAADPVVGGHADDHGWCWTVPWRTRASAETGAPMPPGTGPVIVFRATGETRYLGSAPLAVQLAAVAERRGLS